MKTETIKDTLMVAGAIALFVGVLVLLAWAGFPAD